jgi:hypothetical protein
MARRYVRDNRGRFASTGAGATARGGRLRTAAGNKRATQTMQAASSKPSGTVGAKSPSTGSLQKKAARGDKGAMSRLNARRASGKIGRESGFGAKTDTPPLRANGTVRQRMQAAGSKPVGTMAGKVRRDPGAAKPKPKVLDLPKGTGVPSRAWRTQNRTETTGKGGTKLQVRSSTQGGRRGHDINRVELKETGSNIGNSFEKTRQTIATASPYGKSKPVFRAGNSAGVNKWLDGSQKATAFGGRLANGNRETIKGPSKGRLRGGREQGRAAAPKAQQRRGNTTLAKLASPELRSLPQDRKVGYRELGNRKINRLMTAVRLENLTKAGKLDNYSPSQHRRAQSIHNDAGYTLQASGGIGRNRMSISKAIRQNRQRRAKSS